jgi:hypothetical protein
MISQNLIFFCLFGGIAILGGLALFNHWKGN